MLIRSKHVQFDFEKLRKTTEEVEKAVQKQELSQSNVEYLLSPERFRPFISEVGKRCFYCCEDLQLPVVMWRGYNPTAAEPDSIEMWFHPNCVKRFTQLLIRDANEMEYGKEEADAILRRWKDQND